MPKQKRTPIGIGLWSALFLGAGVALFVGQYLFFNIVSIPAHFYTGTLYTDTDICADTLSNSGSGDYYFFVTGRCKDLNAGKFTYRQELEDRSIPVIDEVTFDGDCSLLHMNTSAGETVEAVVTTHPLCMLFARNKTADIGRYEIHPDGTIEKREEGP